MSLLQWVEDTGGTRWVDLGADLAEGLTDWLVQEIGAAARPVLAAVAAGKGRDVVAAGLVLGVLFSESDLGENERLLARGSRQNGARSIGGFAVCAAASAAALKSASSTTRSGGRRRSRLQERGEAVRAEHVATAPAGRRPRAVDRRRVLAAGARSQKSMPLRERSAARASVAWAHSRGEGAVLVRLVAGGERLVEPRVVDSSSPTIPYHHWWAISWPPPRSSGWVITRVGYSMPPKPAEVAEHDVELGVRVAAEAPVEVGAARRSPGPASAAPLDGRCRRATRPAPACRGLACAGRSRSGPADPGEVAHLAATTVLHAPGCRAGRSWSWRRCSRARPPPGVSNVTRKRPTWE